MSNHLLMVMLTLGFALVQAFVALIGMTLLLCLYVVFERSLRLVMSDG
jgi:hypothetical protein